MEYSTPSRRREPETQIDDKKRPRTSGDPPSEKQSTSTPGLIFLSFPPDTLCSSINFFSYRGPPAWSQLDEHDNHFWALNAAWVESWVIVSTIDCATAAVRHLGVPFYVRYPSAARRARGFVGNAV